MEAPEYIVNVFKDPDILALVKTVQPHLLRKSAEYFFNTYKEFLKDKQKTSQQLIEADKEAKKVEGEIHKFADKLARNENLEKIEDDLPDVHLWHLKHEEYLKRHKGAKLNYLDTPLLWSQCVFYRTLVSIFRQTVHFKDFDVFERIKKDPLLSAETAATKLIEITAKITERIQSGKSTCEEEFENFLQFAVWGNCFDLTWLNFASARIDDFHLIDESKRSRVIANSSKDILQHFKTLPNKTTEITIVLDNSGLELLSDLCFVEMLYQTGLIGEKSKIIFQLKMYPWFVSDATLPDFTWTLNLFQNEYKSEVARSMGRRWNQFLNHDKVWELQTHPFWTCPYPFCEMSRLSPDLYQTLSKSNLIIFCGDFNYRKLISDRVWEQTTPFDLALNGFHPSNIVSLRVVKCRPICGLDKSVKLAKNYWLASKAQEEKEESNDNHIAVIHFCNKNSPLAVP